MYKEMINYFEKNLKWSRVFIDKCIQLNSLKSIYTYFNKIVKKLSLYF